MYSPYETIKITPNGNIYNCSENMYENKNGEEFTKIENLKKLSEKGIQKLKKEYTKAVIEENKDLKEKRAEQNRYLDSQIKH